jgi:hypothetical protein
MRSNEIRKSISLMESINEKIKNKDIVNEANPIGAVARTGKIAAKELEPVFKVLKNDMAFANPTFVKAGVNNADDFLKLLQNDFKSIDNLSNKVVKLSKDEARQLRGAFELNILKSSTTNSKLLDLAAQNLVNDARFIEKYKAVGSEVDFINTLKKNGYSDQGAKAIAKKRTYAKNNPKPKPDPNKTKPDPNKPNPKPIPPQYTKWWDELIKRLKQKKTWKQILLWGLGVGIPASILYAMVTSSGEPLPEDIKEPKIDDQWAACIQELIQNGTGKIEMSGEIVYVNVVTDEYPKGLHFYTSGKVMDIATNKTGTWKCKSGQPVISESKKLSMLSILKEQSIEIDATTMGKYVDSAVWELDGYVDTKNLENVKNILTNLKGKTFQGKDAITEFLSLYSEDEGGDSFVSDVNSVGVKTLGTQAILHKREILSLAQGGGGTTTDTKKGLGNVEITWDGDGKKDDGKKDNRKQSSYHDCTKKPLPHEKFCRSGQVKQVQICLGLPEKYQTGNFGPITIAAIEKLNIDLSNGLTQGVIDSVCKDKDVKLTSNVTTKDIQPGYTPKGLPKVDKSKFDYVNNTSTGTDGSSSSVDNQSTQETPEELYNRLKNEGLLEGDEGVTYYPDGSKIGPSRRIKYLGSSLSSEQLNGLDNVLSGLGYTRIKQKPKNKGLKYVWQINK